MAGVGSKRTKSRFLGRVLVGAEPKSSLPLFLKPPAPALVGEVPDGSEWLHELKFDGYRMQLRLDRGVAAITSRTGLDWTHRFPIIANQLRGLPADRLLLDGEIVSLTTEGKPDFGRLQDDLGRGQHSTIVYFAFDMMFFDGFDLTGAALIDRKDVLRSFIAEANPDRILYSEHFDDGRRLLEKVAILGLEGVVSKRRTSKYKPSKSAWLKTKCQNSCDLHILGYVPSGKDGVAAIRVGRKSGNAFEYVAKVGTGFSRSSARELRERLDQMTVARAQTLRPLRKSDTKWVKPIAKARIAYRGVTEGGALRHPSFKGLVD